jgi:hypothetical protein
MPPKLVGVNTCGSIVGVRRDLADAGYLWIHGGLRPMCDGSTTILSRGHARDAGNR